jgi:hypothetical protein
LFRWKGIHGVPGGFVFVGNVFGIN